MAWTAFPYPDEAYVHTPASLEQAWARLHAGDAEPFPAKATLVDAWIAFHGGQFEKARRMGLNAGLDGYAVAHKASCIYAAHLETNEKKKIAMYEEVAERCERQQAEQPGNAAGYYWHAYGLGRYSQGISVVKALAQGLAPKVRASIEQAIRLAPRHADAYTALGVFHAEIVGSAGAMIGALTYGVKKEEGYKAFKKALELNPDSGAGRIEYAKALVKLEGKKKTAEATALYQEAAALDALDAMERLDVEAARTELAKR